MAASDGGVELRPATGPANQSVHVVANDRRSVEIAAVTAIAAAFLLGFDRNLVAAGLTTGTVVVIALLPVWASSLRDFRFARGLVLLASIALLTGALLHLLNDGRAFKMSLAIEVGLLFVTGIGGLGLLLWARTIVPLHWIVIAFSAGYLVRVLPAIPSSDNPWKYQLAIPVTFLLLAFATRAKGVGPSLIVLAAIGLISIAFDSRSYLGFCLLAFVLVLWQMRQRTIDRPPSKLGTVALLMVAVTALYLIASTLLVEGYLGKAAQARTVEQIQTSGSLLTSGRPEWTGTIELMARNPIGFGLGTVPNSDDVWAAKAGMVAAGVDPDDGYVQVYMFGGHIKLHSIAADMWASFGLVGLATAICMIVIMGYSFLDRLGARSANGLICMAAIIGIWDMLFGPIYSNLPDVMLALAILIPFACPRDSSGDSADPADLSGSTPAGPSLERPQPSDQHSQSRY